MSPLCAKCRSEAETTTVGPEPGRVAKFIAKFTNTPDNDETPQSECDRCNA